MSTESKSLRCLKSLKKHPVYYQSGGDLIIIVGDTSFRVASIFFTRESQDFRDRLAEEGAKADGADSTNNSKAMRNDACATHTIVIEADENVTADDFALLCWVFFNPKFSIYDNTLEAWKTILRLANQWHFAEVKDLAFRQIDHPGNFTMPLVDRIVLYREYKAELTYIGPLFFNLLSRPEPLSTEEGEALGIETALKVSATRERLRASLAEPLSDSQPLPAHMEGAIRQAVCKILGHTAPFPTLNGKPTINGQASASAAKESLKASDPLWGSSAATSVTNTSTATVNGGVNGSGSAADNSEIADKGTKKLSKKEKKKGVQGLYDYDDFYNP